MKKILTISIIFIAIQLNAYEVQKEKGFQNHIEERELKDLDKQTAESVKNGTAKLGIKLLSSLLAEDEKKFRNCFYNIEDIQEANKRFGITGPRAEEGLKRVKELEVMIKDYYKTAQKLIKTFNLTKENVKITKIVTDISNPRNNIVRVSRMQIYFSSNGKSYKIRLADGFKFGDHWKYTDKMKQNISEEG